MDCRRSCGPYRPCGVNGCPYYGDVLIGAGNTARDGDLEFEVERNTVRGRRGGKLRMGYGNDAGRDNYIKVNQNRVFDMADSTDIGAGNRAGRDNRMQVSDNEVRGGQAGKWASIGGRNSARNDNRMHVMRNEVSNATDIVDIGANNTAGWNNDMDVCDNKVRGGRGEVRMGVGNGAGRNNRARVSGNIIE